MSFRKHIYKKVTIPESGFLKPRQFLKYCGESASNMWPVADHTHCEVTGV